MKCFHETKPVYFHPRQVRLQPCFFGAGICYDASMKLKNDVIFEQEIKKSRFLCYLHPCSTEEQAREFFRSIRKLHPSASHHCTAIKIGSLMRSSDDGEPSGTAGRPMLDVLAGSSADQLCAVVVRYFGGTLLGKGRLVRAYSGSVRQALEQAELVEEVEAGLWQMQVPYELCGRAENLLSMKKAQIISRDYLDQAVYCFICEENLQAELDALFSGKVRVSLLDTVLQNR